MDNIKAVEALRHAEALLIAVGAGMGVDSGLPDFRGPQGFWKAYPAYQKLGLRFEALANPHWFDADPELAWGFYGHRLKLYRTTKPHAGFAVLLKWAQRLKHGAFVFTSNVDGHFQQAGFTEDQVCECHGSILHAQCLNGCGAGIFPASAFNIEVNPETGRAVAPLPACPRCNGLARPNILMFGDGDWNAARTQAQQEHLTEWLALGMERLVILEFGAGTSVPTVRRFSEQMAWRHDAALIRINPREPSVPEGQLGISCSALEFLTKWDQALL